MSAMVMSAEQAPGSSMFQRYPTPPPAINYPFNGFGYGGGGPQHPQDYNQFQVPETGVQHWYNAMYGPRSDEWASYGTSGSPAIMTTAQPAIGGYPYRQMGLDYTGTVGGQAAADSPADTSSSSSSSGSPTNKQLRPPYDWMKKASYQSAPTSGKTRTKDKYRVVYSDHQRLELEKEFHYSRYITIRRKAELAQSLALSERQVKIWFQNRRAKERKQNKKREEHPGIKMSPELADLADDKQHLASHMNMMTSHPQHQVQVTSPESKSLHAHNPFSYPDQGQGQMHLSPQNPHTLSPHMTGSSVQYSSPNQMQLPHSPAVNDVIAPTGPSACSVSPQPQMTIKADVDDVPTS